MIFEQETKFGKYQGRDMGETLREICRHMISDTLLKEYSYLGRKGKKRFKDFDNVTKLIVCATLKSLTDKNKLDTSNEHKIDLVPYKSVEDYFTKEFIKSASTRIK